jgi:hypothetical protein
MHNWRKSSYSYIENCVEVATRQAPHAPGVWVRDSKDPGPILAFTPTAWAAFTQDVTAMVHRKAGGRPQPTGSTPVMTCSQHGTMRTGATCSQCQATRTAGQPG